jgi:hypothetical protein
LQFIPDVKKAWRLFSVQIAALIAGLQLLEVSDPTIFDFLPARGRHIVFLLLAIGVIGGRLVHQPVKPAP